MPCFSPSVLLIRKMGTALRKNRIFSASLPCTRVQGLYCTDDPFGPQLYCICHIYFYYPNGTVPGLLSFK